jgi:hypothetical protein
VISVLVRLLRLASFVVCLIVVASFVTFAVNQTKSASTEQQEELGSVPAGTSGKGTSTTTANGTVTTAPAPKHENSFHKDLDEASSNLTSPFGGIVSASAGEWANRGVRLVLALLVYGFGVGYLVRILRVRV